MHRVAFYLHREEGALTPCNVTLVDTTGRCNSDEGGVCPVRTPQSKVWRQEIQARWGLNLVSLLGGRIGGEPAEDPPGGAPAALLRADSGDLEYGLIASCNDKRCADTPLPITFDPDRVSKILCGPLVLPSKSSLDLWAAGLYAPLGCALCIVLLLRKAVCRADHTVRPWPRNRTQMLLPRRRKLVNGTKGGGFSSKIFESHGSEKCSTEEDCSVEGGKCSKQSVSITEDSLKAAAQSQRVRPATLPSDIQFGSMASAVSILDRVTQDDVPIPSDEILSEASAFRNFLEQSVYKQGERERAVHAESEHFDYDFDFYNDGN
eukprot:g5139.t1